MSAGARWARALVHARLAVEGLLSAINRVRLPGPAALPFAGAMVGVYSGLAAGLFANAVQLVSALVTGGPRLLAQLRAGDSPAAGIGSAIAATQWHVEYAIVGAPLGLAALLTARLIRPGGVRDETRRRLRILGLLVLGALSLYYPLEGIAALNAALGWQAPLLERLAELPFWLRMAAPALGGLWVGHLLRNRPETHGHGVPEVVSAIKSDGRGIATRGGALKMLAATLTIGTGGSAGREGPIVFIGAAFASGVGRTLGLSRREIAILMASGAGAGIAASFNVPIAGAMFALEIILREFELTVFSPIVLASVTATMVSRGLMGGAPMLEPLAYQMVSGWEIVGYGALGVLCGAIAFAFTRTLHGVEAFFRGEHAHPLSAWLGTRTLSQRACLGGLGVGTIGLFAPAVWGTGHEVINLAAAGKLGLLVLLAGCVLKLVGTSLTIGSGMTGGTFFPTLVMGGLAGGAFGEALHRLLPSVTAPAGAYATVGMGAAVAALMRGPLTGMMIVYELSGNYSIILPLMVSCTIASAFCHLLLRIRDSTMASAEELLRETPVEAVMARIPPLLASSPVEALADLLLHSEARAAVVLGADGSAYGVAELADLGPVLRDPELLQMLKAIDVARQAGAIAPEASVRTALDQMDQADVDALPVCEPGGRGARGVVTREAIRRFARAAADRRKAEATPEAGGGLRLMG